MRASAFVAGGQPLSAELACPAASHSEAAGGLGLASDRFAAGAVRAGLRGEAGSRTRVCCRQSGADAFAVAVCGRLSFGVATARRIGMVCGMGARCLTLLGNTVQDRSLDLVGVG